MFAALKSVNMLLMFLLELAVYFSAGYWGFTVSDKWLVKVLLVVAAPAALITVWALFGSPKAPYPAEGGMRVVLEVLWFGAGIAALAAAGKPSWAAAFAGLFVLNATLRVVWHQ
ncbi:YrdB family protein [Streptomyces sp. DSM 42041]|uniref:YrdB family protein n=1 Tax=Streptomyces hazeniae TaxID=3075538 RepID=A0ABU2NN95_9ACTN|nr:YrdB family protein [Streptomyces sp. DSM 42041]MDT0378450.1 YrdB family protein [Streptomyces sp. DSM 42041]